MEHSHIRRPRYPKRGACPPIGACAATYAISPISIYVPAPHRCAKWPAPHGARRTRPGALSGRRGRGPAERLTRDAGETASAERNVHLTERTPGRRSRERADRPERHAPASPGPAGTAPGSRRGERPLAGENGPGRKGARREEGAVRPPAIWTIPSGPQTGGQGGVRRSVAGPRGMEKGPGGPSAERYGEKGRGAPRPSPLHTGRAPSTGQRRPALPRADPAVPSALGGLASGFGMGPGVPRPPWPLTGGRRSSVDVENASHASGEPSACPGGRTASSPDPIHHRPELHPPSTCSCARGDATGKSSGD